MHGKAAVCGGGRRSAGASRGVFPDRKERMTVHCKRIRDVLSGQKKETDIRNICSTMSVSFHSYAA
ncbi:unknown [Prevotella sp. CAG:487]|nr:unknown [Prevotella sp. CAG:487]